jgi:hypothetical protein
MASIDLNALFAAQAAENNNSKKDMIYTTDDGTEYIVNITENIGEAFGFDDVVSADVGVVPILPRGWKMRKVLYADATGNISGSYFVGKPNTLVYSEGGTITVPRKGKAGGVLVAVTGSTGEYKKFGKSFDTGQDSGDET